MKLTVGVRGYDTLQKAMNRLLKNVQNRAPIFAKCQAIMHQDVLRHFRDEVGPDGKWERLKDATIMRRRHGKKKSNRVKILQDTGMLRGLIASVSGSNGAQVGSNMVYAKTHQFGDPKRNIPQRTFLFMSDDAENRILDQFEKAFWRNP